MIKERYNKWFRHLTGNRNKIFGLRITKTWRCDSRCTTCSIWEIKYDSKKDLSVEDVDRFSRSKYLNSVEYITISGGEPTLCDDLPDMISVLHRNIPAARFNITTNGMNPNRIEKQFEQILNENPEIRFGSVGLSLNGPKEIHDSTRGIDGSFDKVLETYERLKHLVPCRFSFTFCRENVDHFHWVQEFAKSKGTTAYICWTVMNERFQVSERDLVFWDNDVANMLTEFVSKLFRHRGALTGAFKNIIYQPEGIRKSYFFDHVLNKKVMPCYAGSQIVHIDPVGNVYPCNFKLSEDRVLGNLKNEAFDAIWENIPRNILHEIKCGECMYPNGLCGDSDIYPSVMNHPPAVAMWYAGKILKNKELIEIP
ncbi:MAG: hypothetical protein DRJ65_08030 [Acidobacteria bacterium]|nr:MAG: hypothetical protein DRJ65_08030 [Acidobacteriota bacterium]